jgi:hypothetical protein
MEKHIWINLINNFCDETILDSYGFTIPFIIGIERNFNNRVGFMVANLFEDIKENNIVFTISDCPDLDEIIIGQHKKSYPNPNSLKKIGNFLINSEEIQDIDTIAQLISFFDDKYYNEILDNKFSKNYYTNNWSDFDNEDKKLINKLLNI